MTTCRYAQQATFTAAPKLAKDALGHDTSDTSVGRLYGNQARFPVAVELGKTSSK